MQAPLPPKEVLRRAGVAMQTLPPSLFSLSGRTAGGSGSLSFALQNGRMQDQGRKLSFGLEVQSGSGSGFSADVLVLDGCDIYVLPKRGTVPFISAVQRGTSGSGTWLHMACGITAPPAASSDRDAIVRALDVADIPPDRDTVFPPAYHYRVSLNAQNFLDTLSSSGARRGEEEMRRLQEFLDAYRVRGELWISKDDFTLSRYAWDIGPVRGSGSQASSLHIEGWIGRATVDLPVDVPQLAVPAIPSFPDGASRVIPLLLPLFGGSPS